jgi:hypothetical protein
MTSRAIAFIRSMMTVRPVMLAAAVMLFLPGGSPAAAPGDIRIDVADGRLSADIGEDMPVTDMLAVVARALGAPIFVRGDLGRTRAQTFTGAPLVKGLERLVALNRLMIEYAPQRNPKYDPAIVRLRVFGDGAAGERQIEPAQVSPGGKGSGGKLAAATGGSGDGAQQERDGPPDDDPQSPLNWSYDDDDEQLPPLAARIRRIAQVTPASGEAGLAALSGVLDADPDASVRVAAVRAVAGFRNEDSEMLLDEALLDDEASVRLAAVTAIGSGTLSEAPVSLIDLLTDEDEESRVRLAALDVLRRFPGDDDAREAITDAAEAEDAEVRAAARKALQP